MTSLLRVPCPDCNTDALKYFEGPWAVYCKGCWAALADPMTSAEDVGTSPGDEASPVITIEEKMNNKRDDLLREFFT